MYRMCAVIAPLAGKPQNMHIVSIQLRRNGSVTISSTVSCRLLNTSGRSGNTHGRLITKGAPPAVVARNPASCRRFMSETADIVPHRSFSRSRNADHWLSASSGSVACLRSVALNPPRLSSSEPIGNRQ